MSSLDYDKTNDWKVTLEFLHHIEKHAEMIRQRAKVGPLDKLDPFEMKDQLNINISYPDKVKNLPTNLRAYIYGLDAKAWSGMSYELDGGRLLIILNPNQTPERAKVTILEEVAHNYYGHEPSQLDGTKRTYNKSLEREAYWTAAATLLPSKVVAMAVWRSQLAETLAKKLGVSTELVEMRIKTLGLWNTYKTRLS